MENHTKINKNVAVVFHTGIGDALQLVPLIRSFSARGQVVAGIFASSFLSDCVIGPLQVLDHRISVRQGMVGWLTLVFRHFRRFDTLYLDYTSSAPRWLLISSLLAKKVICNRWKWYFNFFPNLCYRPPLPNVHLFDQHFHLGDAAPVLAPGTARYYSLSYPPNFADPSLLGRWVTDGAPYVVLQVCAANNRVGYKNWPVEKWVEFLRLIESGYPSTVIFVVGDRNETEYGAAMEAAGLPGVRFLVGKTDYRELATLVAHASHYIGLDSGTMHLAAMMGKPTFVLWGASDAYTIGYGVFDPIRHVDLSAGLPCQPCYSWIRPNRSLVDNPLKCPDYRCIRDMPVLSVWEAYVRFVEQNGLAADH